METELSSRVITCFSNGKVELLLEACVKELHQFESLIGPVAWSHASIERAMNNFILEGNENLTTVKKLHFSFDLCTRIIMEMKYFNLSQVPQLGQSLRALNKLRNHLVHPSEISFDELVSLYRQLLAYLRASPSIQFEEPEGKDFEEIAEKIIRIFTFNVLGIMRGYSEGHKEAQKLLVELKL